MQGCDPVRILRLGEAPGSWSLYLPCEGADDALIQVRWLLCAESGERCYEREEGPGLTIAETRSIVGRRHIRLTFGLPPDLPLGYYEAQGHAQGGSTDVHVRFRLIVVPDRCYVPEIFQQGGRLWGLALQLYSLRSQRNWGVGDFHDLAEVVEWAGKGLGAAMIGLNPLHALKNSKPYHMSPYSPSSRLFLNDLYIDVESVPECRTAPAVQARLADPSFRVRIEAARQGELVDYDVVASAKREILNLCYQAFLRDNFEGTEPELKPHTERGERFHRYVLEEGEPLRCYALFQALEEERQAESVSRMWTDWPEGYRIPTSDAVREFQCRQMHRVRFFLYLQWLAAEQLVALKKKTAQVGMPIGLYHDLALGSDRHGADGWRFQDVLALGADCGAPPDAFAPEGQNWGFSPADPLRLRESGYQYVIELFRNNFRYGGAIRLDHVMALFRLFWIPRGAPASQGTYVHYPAEDLLAILALESTRACTLVIGEDLGTVPDWVRDRLRGASVLSYRVFYFERTGSGDWKSPGTYPAQSLAVVTTHDLPPLSGYWEGADIQTRNELGLLVSEQARIGMLAERQADKARILAALRSEGLLPPGISDDPVLTPVMTWELADAIHQYLARTPAWMVLANIEDMIGLCTQTNVPGTVDQHPNWQRKLNVMVEDLAQDSRFTQLAARLRSTRSLG
ncbi:MAG: 4-alpha-glucanotransferase [Nitrospira sp.]|nr:4-alpha-glucanotransferase [Nitrospira sp.]